MFYVDIFNQTIVKEKEQNALPERYYKYRKGMLDKRITETYIISRNPLKLVSFYYSIEDNKGLISAKRLKFWKEYNIFDIPTLYSLTVPPKIYEETIRDVEK